MKADDVIYVDEKGNQVAPPKGASPSVGMNYPPVNRSLSEKGDLMDKIRPDSIVEVMRHRLMGQEFINGKWQDIACLKDRAITEIGAWEITGLMLPASSQNVSISKLTDREIRERTLEIVRTAQNMLLTNWKEYGVKSRATFEYVHQILMTNTFITLKQPEGGGIRKLIQGTTHESTVHSNQNTSRGFSVFRGRRL
jgi:hypothetical protein